MNYIVKPINPAIVRAGAYYLELKAARVCSSAWPR
jgi:hypothetical protein